MQRKILLILLPVMVSMLTGCATMVLEKMIGDVGTEYLHEEYIVNISKDQVFNLAVDVLKLNNMEIDILDKAKGVMSTPYKDKRIGLQKALGSVTFGKVSLEEAIFIEISSIDDNTSSLKAGIRARETNVFERTKPFKYGDAFKTAIPLYNKSQKIAKEIVNKTSI